MDRHAAARHSALVSVWVNFCLSIAQIAVGLLARSQALVADGIHSLSDLISDFVVIAANRQSRLAPDANHPYGHYRFETAASLFLGLLMLAVSAGIGWNAIVRLSDVASIPVVHASAVWTAALALVAKELLFRYMLGVGRRVGSGMLVANAWHARSDAASSLVVLVGIAANSLGFPIGDPIASLIVAALVARMGASIGWSAMSDLMDHAAGDEEISAIELAVAGVSGVQGFHDLRTRTVGDFVLVDIHIEVDESLSVKEGHQIAESVQRKVKTIPKVLDVMTHVDPVPVLTR
ncbi:cation diffusion facilitator family transporter [Pandoraea apista]|uniref:Cation transporter n=1 Tax=Pandoraea apista TaxID=93218 RepID=A0A0D5W8T7_9BURK|nr:cation diffusion facilitator family transporter [Pandoraea apista]AJZ74763.1 cobalt transporter [Pandoraea apista]AKH71502.1 cobalt transporter [Pandoraea apista]AKI63775.1 cobalt transporter [Pandoraea apista]ALS67118.1 cation-efflux pump [Pandoraea apista]AVF42174.1 cation transporter [Pandoraea apista]